ncbi:unnamed protein product [Cochlearia groenlandica]
MSMKESTEQKSDQKQTWRDLPLDLMVTIMSYLDIKDNIIASVVSKSWHEAAVSVRNTDEPPWLISFSSLNNTYEFYDPSNQSTKHKTELPKSLSGYKVRYSKDGWLLMCTSNSSDFVLFNPFTKDIVVLPDLEMLHEYQLVGFSCAPTSSNCVVFTVNDYDPGHLIIRTWSPGESKWNLMETDSQFLDAKQNYVVFSNGMFYCLGFDCFLAVFDPLLRTWNVLDVSPPEYDEFCCDGKFMVSYKDDVFVICTFGNKEPFVFKLDLTRGVWEKKENLGSLTIFASVNSCEPRTYVDKGMMRRNSIYFSKLCYEEETCCCLTYSFDEERYKPRRRDMDLGVEFLYKSIWVETPENALEIVHKQT